jgi:hypothetical protein
MKTVQFKDVPVDTTFFMNNVEYKKVVEKKISCCKSINCALASDVKQTGSVKPLVEVQVND